jgi:hypothetical protein
METINLRIAFMAIALVFSGCLHESDSKQGMVYYFDSTNGSDTNTGTSPEDAWQTLSKVSVLKLNPGDKLLLKGGDIFTGYLFLDSVLGTPENPVTIASYGTGRAMIHSGNTFALFISNSRYVDVNNINAVGAGRKDGNTNSGIEFYNVQFGSIDSVEVSGYQVSGVKITGGSDISITHAYAHNNGLSGILVSAIYDDNVNINYKPVRNLYIGYCVAENNPGSPAITDNHSGNGILVGGVVNGIIEYCEAFNNGWDMPRKGNGPVGIWAYKSDSMIIQHCYAHNNKTSPQGHDGGGFDFDGGVTNSIMQYNLSAYNEGSGFGMYQYLEATPWENNIVRFNISYLDGRKNGKAGIHMWVHPDNENLPIRNLAAYNNTIINDAGYGINFEPGVYENFVFENNILYLTGNANQFIGGTFEGAVFDNNLYWSDAEPDKTFPPFSGKTDPNMITENPQLVLPPHGVDFGIQNIELLKTIEYFRLRDNSPAIGAGKTIPDRGNYDFWGNLTDSGKAANIGADEGRK